MRQMISLILVGTLALLLAPITLALADQDFHTERLSFFLTAEGAAAEPPHPPLRSGHIVDIHANGPQIGALERYMINGAQANSSYDVVLELFEGDCEGAESPSMTTTTLETNQQGNAHGGFVFTAEDLVPFSGAVVGVRWTLVDVEGIIAYATPCIVVTVD
jgi:hypothetical protein